MLRLGVAGYSGQKFSEQTARRYLIEGMDEFVQHFEKDPKEKIEIVSGLTDVGIPALAYRIGEQRGYYLVGITAEQGLEYELYPVSKKIIIGQNFGDESPRFLKYIDGLLKVGGGRQSREEYREFLTKYPDKWARNFDLEAL